MYNIKEKVQDCDIKELNEENTEFILIENFININLILLLKKKEYMKYN